MRHYRRYLKRSKIFRAIEYKKRIEKYKKREYNNTSKLLHNENKNENNTNIINPVFFMFPCIG